MSKRLDSILKENADFEKKAPYNFCDRWCERCAMDTQHRCKLYLDDFERQITNIAHGRDEHSDEFLLDLYETSPDSNQESFDRFVGQQQDDEFERVVIEDLLSQDQALKQHALYRLAQQYMEQTHQLLQEIYFQRDDLLADEQYDFETIAWYHTLLPVKIFRVLSGVYESSGFSDEYSLRDIVAQCSICKKAIAASDKAWRNIRKRHSQDIGVRIESLLSLLYTVCSRIKAIEYRI